MLMYKMYRTKVATNLYPSKFYMKKMHFIILLKNLTNISAIYEFFFLIFFVVLNTRGVSCWGVFAQFS